MGMIGGSKDAFIGNVHRMAAALDGKVELVCGAFSSDAQRSKDTGQMLGLEPSRVYASYEEMMLGEKQLPESKRMQFVSIVTPNHLHFKPAMLALEHGFHVLCEKPLAFSLQEAQTLAKATRNSGLLFGLTHNYTGYPMVKEARHLIKAGALGQIRKIIAEYPQGWLSAPIEQEGQKQASWRTNPQQAGLSCCVGDIGTHAENLAEYITGLRITELCADVSTFVEGRLLDDDANILLRFENGAKGVIIASQIANGDENELRIRVYGVQGSIEWLQSDPNSLVFKQNDKPMQILRTGGNHSYLSAQARAHTRLPAGHPEGYLESMANLYRNFAEAIMRYKQGEIPDPMFDFPTIDDGVRGMKFIETAIASGKDNAKWLRLI